MSASSHVPARGTAGQKQYKVISISEGGCGTVLLGAAAIPVRKVEDALNREVANGWSLDFMVVEQRRYLLFWARETVIVTLVRAVT